MKISLTSNYIFKVSQFNISTESPSRMTNVLSRFSRYDSSAKEKVEFHPSNPIPFLDQFRYLSRDLWGVNSLKLWQISRVCRRFFSLLVHPIHLSAIYLYTRPRSFHYRGRSGAADVKISFNVSTSDGPIFPHFLWKIRAPFRGWSAIDSIASCRRKKNPCFPSS